MAGKIKKGDEVVILTGKDKGRRGVVKQVIPAKSRIVVENINVVKKHVKPNPNAGVEGGIVEMENPLHISNVAIFNPQTEKADKVGFRILDDGRKVRAYKSSGETIDV